MWLEAMLSSVLIGFNDREHCIIFIYYHIKDLNQLISDFQVIAEELDVENEDLTKIYFVMETKEQC